MNHIEYLRQIGSKGGEKRATNPDKHELASNAATASWSPKARAKRLRNKRATNRKTVKRNLKKVLA